MSDHDIHLPCPDGRHDFGPNDESLYCLTCGDNPWIRDYVGISDAEGFWRDGVLWWRIGRRSVPDTAFRTWCYQNMPYPWNHVDVVRKIHIDAWAAAHGETLAETTP
jgi:hypothetical protein